MKDFSSVPIVALGAAALSLLAGGLAAQPLVPRNLVHRHRPLHETDSPAAAGSEVRSGVSDISRPRFGSGFAAGPLVPRSAVSPSTVLPPIVWTANGPAPIADEPGFGTNPEPASGRVAAIASDPADPKTYYIGAAGGGVWKTTNSGASYIPLTDFLGDTAIGAVAVAPNNRNVVYAGTGEGDYSGDCKYGIGLLRSADGGASWSVIPGPRDVFYRRAISRIVVDPTNASIVYLTVTNAANALPGNHGVWKSTDAGRTWINTTASINTTNNYTALVIDPKNPQTLYAAISRNAKTAIKGVYKTANGGASWTKLTGGLPLAPAAPVGYTTLAISPSSPQTLYASITNNGSVDPTLSDSLLGLYKTTDGGAHWTRLANAPNYLGFQGSYDNSLAVSPTDPNTLYAAGQVNYNAQTYEELTNLVGTHDGGKTFQDYSVGQGYLGPHTDTHALVYTADAKLLDGNDGGVWRLDNPQLVDPINQPADGSADISNILWSDINGNLNTIQFTGVALHPTDPKIAFGGSQDNGTEMTTGSLAWHQVTGGDGGFVRIDQTNPETVYATYYGISLMRSDDGGNTFVQVIAGINQMDKNLGNPTTGYDPSSFYVPYKLDPLNQKRVILGTDHLYESLNKGDLFKTIGYPGVNGFNPYDEVVSALAVYGNTIYVSVGNPLGGDAFGAIYVTTNDGATWIDIRIPTIEDLISDIYVNPTNPKDVYAARPLFDDNAAGKIFRSTNGGLKWNDISSNLPDEPFNAVILDKRSGTLYAGADDGVYASTNYGGSWTQVYQNLPNVQVANLDLNDRTGILAAGTHGRGMWTLPLSTTVATPNIIANAAVSRLKNGMVQVTLTLLNSGTANLPAGTGNADAVNAVLKTLTLNGKSALTSPAAVGVIPAYGQAGTLTFTLSGIASGNGLLQVAGAYNGGTFSTTLRVTVP